MERSPTPKVRQTQPRFVESAPGKHAARHEQQRYPGLHLIGNAFWRHKAFRRVATLYDKVDTNFLSVVALATTRAFGL
jgi:transposase